MIIKTVFGVFLTLIFAASCFADVIRQTTDSDFYGGSLNAAAVVNTGAGASIKLKSGQFSMPGNGFIVAGYTDYLLYNPGDRLAMAFSLPLHLTVTAAVIYGQWIGSTGSYECGILADSYGGTSPVIAQWLSPGTHNEAHNTLAPGSSYYVRVSFTSDAVLSANTPYHLFLKGLSGLDGSNYLKPRSTTPNNMFFATYPHNDPYQQILQSIDAGLNWSENSGNQPVFILEYLDPLGGYLDASGRPVSYIGNPYSSYVDTNVYGNFFVGQDFQVKNPATIIKVRAYAQSGGAAPADDLHVVIQDITNPLSVVMLTDEIFLSKTNIFPGFSWINYTLINPVSFVGNHTYRIFFKSSGSSSAGYYTLKGSQIYRNASQNSVFSEDALTAASFGGRESYLVYTTGAGTSWDDFNRTRDLLVYMSDSYSTLYVPSGNYWSPPFDTKGQSSFTSMSWSPASQDPLTGAQPVKFQAAANNDNATWDYIGPDGTPNTWFTDPAAAALPGVFGNKRYIRYKLTLTTQDNTVSPVIDSVDIYYNARPSSNDAINLTSYPNPFNPATEETVIRYTLAENSGVKITVMTPFSVIVRKFDIKAGDEGGKGTAAGYENKVVWDGRNDFGMTVESGVYICHVEVGSKLYKRKIAVLR